MANLSQNQNINQVAANKQLAGKIISYVTTLSNNKLNWFWQLFSNAIENVDPSNTIKVKVNFKNNNCVQFQHNGKPFTYDNINAIVNQTTTKPQQLGLGLMSVIALTPNIELQGILSDKDTNTTFFIHLDRQTESFNKLVNNIQTSKQSLINLPQIKQTQVLTGGMTTRFRLFTSKTFDEEINILKSQILSLFAFNKQLLEIQIINKGESTIYTKPISGTHSSGIKFITLDKSKKLGKTLFFVQQKDFTIAIPIVTTENSLMLQQIQNSIFKKYPLLFEGVNFPFIVNSNKFSLDLDRNKLASSKENNKIIKQSFKTFYKVLETIIEITQQRQLLFSIHLNKQLNDIQIQYCKFIEKQPIILLQNGTYSNPQSIKFPLIQTSNYVAQTFISLSLDYFKLSNQFLDEPINSSSYKKCLQIIFLKINEWIKFIRPYQLKQFIDHLPTLSLDELVETISKIPNYESSNKQNIVADYFNSLYKFLLNQFPMYIFSPKSRIILNSNYKFTKLKGLHQVESTLPQPIIRFAIEQLELDIKEIILAPGLVGDMFDLDKYQLKQIGKLLLKQLDKSQLSVADLVKILKFISIFFKYEDEASDDRKVRKHIYNVFKHLKIFQDVKQYHVDGQIDFDYVPFIRKIVDAIFVRIRQTIQLKDIYYLADLLVFQKTDDVIQWFNSFQQLLNILKCDPIYDMNLNQNNQFEHVENLLIPDTKITNFEIELFDKLPVELNLGGKFRTIHQKLGNILLNDKINEGIFLKQKINRLTIDEFLESIVEKFRQQEKDLKPQRSQMILDYCDNLYEQYEKSKDQDIYQKMMLMKQVRDQTPSSLELLRLNTDEQKLFVWRLTKQKEAYQRLKILRKHLRLSNIVEMAGKYQSVDQSIRNKQQQVKKLKADIEKTNKDWQSKIQKLQINHKGIISNIQKKTNILTEENLGLKRKLQDTNRTYQKIQADSQNMTKNQRDLQLKLKQTLEQLKKNELITKNIKNDYDKLKIESQNKLNNEANILKILEEKNNSYDQLKEKYQQLEQLEHKNQQFKIQKQKQNSQLQEQTNFNQILKEEQKKQESVHQQQKTDQHILEPQPIQNGVQETSEIQRQTSQVSNKIQSQQNQFIARIENPNQKSKVEQDFESVTKSAFKYDTQIKCYSLTNSQGLLKAYLMLFPAQIRSQIPHSLLNKLYKIKIELYIGIIPSETTHENILRLLKVYTLQDIGIDKHYSYLKQAQSKQNAAKRAKVGDGTFQFNYYVNVSQKNEIRSKTYEELLNLIN